MTVMLRRDISISDAERLKMTHRRTYQKRIKDSYWIAISYLRGENMDTSPINTT